MAKLDGTDPALFLNPLAYSQVKGEKKMSGSNVGSSRTGSVLKSEKADAFSKLLGKTADELGPLQNLPVSDDSVNLLMDEVRDSGDVLLNRPLPEEILRYKQAVRNFINYIVKNCYSMEREDGIPNKHRPSFQGRRNSPEGDKGIKYTKIQVIDKKLEDLAAILLTSQVRQLELTSRLEEIRGLLIDLLQ